MAEPLKNQLLLKSFHEKLGTLINQEYSKFSSKDFIQNVYDQDWEERSLTERMSHTSVVLQQMLPQEYVNALEVLKKVCSHFDGFDGMVFSDFVQQFGQGYLKESLDALELFTQHGSSEFAIRPFIKSNTKEVMRRMLDWSKHENYHVRRLSSEGCRPRLPWSMALPDFKKDPSLVLPILENLKSDPELYVRKSVANNINDLAKDNPEIVLRMVSKWMKKPSRNTQWIVKQGLRSLVKDGNSKALKILGFDADNLELNNFKKIPTKVEFGASIEIEFELANKSDQQVNAMVDYIIYHQKNNGTLAPKVFKLKAITIPANEKVGISKAHNFVPINTRKYYPGTHKVAIQVNGKVLNEAEFKLVM